MVNHTLLQIQISPVAINYSVPDGLCRVHVLVTYPERGQSSARVTHKVDICSSATRIYIDLPSYSFGTSVKDAPYQPAGSGCLALQGGPPMLCLPSKNFSPTSRSLYVHILKERYIDHQVQLDLRSYCKPWKVFLFV